MSTLKEKTITLLLKIQAAINRILQFLEDVPDTDGKSRLSMTRLTMIIVVGYLVYSGVHEISLTPPVVYDIPTNWLIFLLGLYGINKAGIDHLNIGGK
jgi:hypothetical protein